MHRLLPLLLGGSFSGLLACGVPASSASVDVEMPASSGALTEWQPVADYLNHRCGDLDCHGDPQRNFIIYACNGLRLTTAAGGPPAGFDFPGLCVSKGKTTLAEYDTTYRSLVGLEPLVIAQVFASQGADADLLTFVRKARGEEAHKGGALITPGDAQDQCITSWLAGATNAAACAQAITSTP